MDLVVVDEPDRPNLPELAKRINEEHYAALAAGQSFVQHVHNCGVALLDAKSQVKHGEWGKWLILNCDVAPSTARRYMQIAKRPPVSDLDEIDGGLRGYLSGLAKARASAEPKPAEEAEVPDPEVEPPGTDRAAAPKRDPDEAAREHSTERIYAFEQHLRETAVALVGVTIGDFVRAGMQVAPLRMVAESILDHLNRLTDDTPEVSDQQLELPVGDQGSALVSHLRSQSSSRGRDNRGGGPPG